MFVNITSYSKANDTNQNIQQVWIQLVRHLRTKVVRCDSARVTPYLWKQSIQMDIPWLVLELQMKTVGICLLSVRCGRETVINVCVIKERKFKW